MTTLDQVLSADQIGTYEKTSVMAQSVGAVAAINGGLNSSPGRPTHQYVLDGNVMQTGMRVGVSFGLRHDEKGGTMGRHPIKITAVDKATGATVRVKSWNEHTPGTDQVVGYTPYGGTEEKPSTSQCSARLTLPTRPRWNPGENGLRHLYTVDAVACVMMLVVDGRTSVSEGFTLHRLGHWMRDLGVVNGVNLDGGGSATM